MQLLTQNHLRIGLHPVDFFKRQIMKFIIRKGGGPTDASQDYEFTDWDALAKFVDSFIDTVGA